MWVVRNESVENRSSIGNLKVKNVDNFRKDRVNILTLKFNDQESLVFSSHSDVFNMRCWDGINIDFCGIVSINLFDNNGERGLGSAIELLEKSLNNKLKLHNSIKTDVGYLWNEELQGKAGLAYETGDENLYWVGERFLMWSTNSRLKNRGTTWLYNNEKGDIILEITPVYPWTFRDPEPGETYVSYDEYMKTYKSLIVRTISHETAKEWLRQIQDLERTIQQSEKMMDDPAVQA